MYKRQLGSCVIVEEGAVIEDSIILPNTTVGSGSHIVNTVVNEGAVVESDMKIGDADGETQVYGETHLSF